MASDKQRRRQARRAHPRKPGTPHSDGDRRRRGGPSVDQALRDKRARREFPGVPADDSGLAG